MFSAFIGILLIGFGMYISIGMLDVMGHVGGVLLGAAIAFIGGVLLGEGITRKQ